MKNKNSNGTGMKRNINKILIGLVLILMICDSICASSDAFYEDEFAKEIEENTYERVQIFGNTTDEVVLNISQSTSEIVVVLLGGLYGSVDDIINATIIGVSEISGEQWGGNLIFKFKVTDVLNVNNNIDSAIGQYLGDYIIYNAYFGKFTTESTTQGMGEIYVLSGQKLKTGDIFAVDAGNVFKKRKDGQDMGIVAVDGYKIQSGETGIDAVVVDITNSMADGKKNGFVSLPNYIMISGIITSLKQLGQDNEHYPAILNPGTKIGDKIKVELGGPIQTATAPDGSIVEKKIVGLSAAVEMSKEVIDKTIAVIETNKGTIKFKLYTSKAPKTTENFIKLASDGFYSGLVFHRVIPGFMIQGGGFYADGTQKESPYGTINLEINQELVHDDGAVAMARTNDPNSATSQFYICDGPQHFLDGQYAVFGKVIEGMDIVKSIASVETATRQYHENWPVENVIIKSITIEEIESQIEESLSEAKKEVEKKQTCPYSCCVGESNYYDKSCSSGYSCVNNKCVRDKQACPYSCCVGESNYYDKYCSSGYSCANHNCVKDKQTCPYSCCVGESNYYDKSCSSGYSCANHNCVKNKQNCPYICCSDDDNEYEPKKCEEGYECVNHECERMDGEKEDYYMPPSAKISCLSATDQSPAKLSLQILTYAGSPDISTQLVLSLPDRVEKHGTKGAFTCTQSICTTKEIAIQAGDVREIVLEVQSNTPRTYKMFSGEILWKWKGSTEKYNKLPLDTSACEIFVAGEKSSQSTAINPDEKESWWQNRLFIISLALIVVIAIALLKSRKTIVRMIENE